MNQDYFDEVFRCLQEAGWKPEWCDVAVPLIGNTVQAGLPTEVGDVFADEYTMLPRSLARCGMIVCLPVRGDSMEDCGILEGDKLSVQITEGCCGIREGDIVVAEVDGDITVKTFFRDESGDVWLLPRNKKYLPIHLTEGMNARILGKVKEIRRETPHTSTSEMLRIMEGAKEDVCATSTLESASTLPSPASLTSKRGRNVGRKKEHLFSLRNGEKNEDLTSEKVNAFKAELAQQELLDEPINCSKKSPFNIAFTACYKAWEKEKLVPTIPNGRAIYRFLAEDCGFTLPDVKTYAEFIRKMIA